MPRKKKPIEPIESPLFWPAKLKGSTLWILDETKIPEKTEYLKVKDTSGSVKAIKDMKTRAFGQFLVVLYTFLLEMNNAKKDTPEHILEKLKKTAKALERSRPTFPFKEITSVFVFWAKEAVANKLSIKKFVGNNIQSYLEVIRLRKLQRIQEISEAINDGDSILTHCNVSGELAMAASICKKQKKKVHYFATETRPYMQGARLTCWELKEMGVSVTLVADNAVGTLMSDGLVNKVIVGSDNSCANGDFANKIGTYQIAVLAKEFKIPFYALIQKSEKIYRGSDIPIEIRDPKELLTFGRKKTYKEDVDGFYPAFDVIPSYLVSKRIVIEVK